MTWAIGVSVFMVLTLIWNFFIARRIYRLSSEVRNFELGVKTFNEGLNKEWNCSVEFTFEGKRQCVPLPQVLQVLIDEHKKINEKLQSIPRNP